MKKHYALVCVVEVDEDKGLEPDISVPHFVWDVVSGRNRLGDNDRAVRTAFLSDPYELPEDTATGDFATRRIELADADNSPVILDQSALEAEGVAGK
jgi:hypothetical protein